ncbi:MAG: lantibiotic dehydratase C-terminal domain-containing protein, partial [Bacteroidota bacterium]
LTADQKQPIYQPLWDILAIRSSKMSPTVNELKSLEKAKKLPIPLAFGIIPSYLHMVCNRIFLSKQRVHEMVVYDFLFKYYSKMLHTQKKKVAKK